jgi:hypothetical protein
MDEGQPPPVDPIEQRIKEVEAILGSRPSGRKGRRAKRDSVPNPSTHEEAIAWAHSHSVLSNNGGIAISLSGHLKSDLNLAPQSLPLIVDLLNDGDSRVVLTATMALRQNGVQVETDGGDDIDPTYFRATFPNGEVRTIDAANRPPPS